VPPAGVCHSRLHDRSNFPHVTRLCCLPVSLPSESMQCKLALFFINLCCDCMITFFSCGPKIRPCLPVCLPQRCFEDCWGHQQGTASEWRLQDRSLQSCHQSQLLEQDLRNVPLMTPPLLELSLQRPHEHAPQTRSNVYNSKDMTPGATPWQR
jgi:hypothetical protein